MSKNLFTYPNFPPNLEFKEPHFSRYLKFIETRMLRKLPEGIYTEKHHIIPKSLKGSNDKENLILLTAREHFIAHMILWKGVGKGMTHAFFFLCNNNHNFSQFNSRIYQRLKKEYSVINSGTSNPFYGKKHSTETIEFLREINKGPKPSIQGENHPMYGKHHTEETKLKLSIAGKGKQLGEKNGMYGKKHTQETKDKMSKVRKGVKKSPWSEESKMKKSIQQKNYLKNHPHAMMGKKHSIESRQNISESLKGKNAGENNYQSVKVICIETGEVYVSISDAAKANSTNKRAVSLICRGLQKTTKGLTFKYYNEYNTNIKIQEEEDE